MFWYMYPWCWTILVIYGYRLSYCMKNILFPNSFYTAGKFQTKRNDWITSSNNSNSYNIYKCWRMTIERPLPWLRRPLLSGRDEEEEEDDDEEDEGIAKGPSKFLKIKYVVLLGIYIHDWGTILCMSKLLWVHSDFKS